MLVCPDCDHRLEPKTVTTGAPGGHIEIDQCTYCGGVWFDHFEINRLPTYHAISLSSQVPDREIYTLNGPNRCPHCHVPLRALKTRKLSTKNHVKKCPHCRGHWVSKKDLVAVKKKQDENLTRVKLMGIPLVSAFAVLIPLLLLGLVTLTIPFTVNRIKDAKRAKTKAAELISIPLVIPVDVPGEARSVIISFNTSRTATSTIKLIGPERTKPTNLAVSILPSTLHTIRLTGLSSNTVYIYTISLKLTNGIEVESKKYEFKTK